MIEKNYKNKFNSTVRQFDNIINSNQKVYFRTNLKESKMHLKKGNLQNVTDFISKNKIFENIGEDSIESAKIIRDGYEKIILDAKSKYKKMNLIKRKNLTSS